jgi:putative ABC transport system substrate-binding protein
MQFARLKRREFFRFLGGAAAAWPLGASAQQPAMRVIGLLGSTSLADRPYLLAAFRGSLNALNFVEGKNVVFEYRWAEGQYDRLPALAAELVRRRVDVVVAPGPPACALAAKAATSSIPIVFMTGGDPIMLGLVASLNRPGGNLTGVSLFNVALVPKQLELVRELVPKAALVAALVNPSNPNTETEQRELTCCARVLSGTSPPLSQRSPRGARAPSLSATMRSSRACAINW